MITPAIRCMLAHVRFAECMRSKASPKPESLTKRETHLFNQRNQLFPTRGDYNGVFAETVKLGLVEFIPYGGSQLTEAGRAALASE